MLRALTSGGMGLRAIVSLPAASTSSVSIVASSSFASLHHPVSDNVYHAVESARFGGIFTREKQHRRPKPTEESKQRKKDRRHPGGRGSGGEIYTPDVKPAMDFDMVQTRNDKIVESYEETLLKFRAGGASPALLQNIKVKLYGVQTDMKSVGRVFKKDDTMLHIQAFDPKGVNAIVEAVGASNLGLTALAPEGNIIKVPVPKMTAEFRTQLTKGVKTQAESTRVLLRNLRKKAIKELGMSMDASSEDFKAMGEKQIHDMYTVALKNVEDLTVQRVKDIQS